MWYHYACVGVVVCCILNIGCTRSEMPGCEQTTDIGEVDLTNGTGSVTESVNISLSDGNITSGSISNLCNDTWAASSGSEELGPSPRVLPEWRITLNKVNFVIRGIYFPIITVLAIVGNAITVSILRKDFLNSSSTIYLLGLALADLLFVCSFAPTVASAYPTIKVLPSFKTFYSFYISFFFPLVNVFHTVAVWITVTFTVERLIAVAFPIKAQKYCTRSRAKLTIGCCFMFGIALNSVRFFRRTVEQFTDPVTQETYYIYKLYSLGLDKMFEKVFFWLYFLATKAIPFPVLACLNSAVLWKIWRARSVRLSLKGNVDKDDKISRENQITRMLVCIVMAFFLCNAAAGGGSLFVALYGMQGLYSSEDPGLYYMFAFGEALINTNPLVNCILYAACSQAMRNEIRGLFCLKRYSRAEIKPPPLTEDTGVN